MMMNQQEASSWRDFLGQRITDTREKLRMARAIGVQPITLQRWARGSAKPQRGHIRLLLEAFPADQRVLFEQLLVQAFPDLGDRQRSDKHLPKDIPSAFTAKILHAYAVTPASQCRQVIMDLVLQQAIQHLDPERLGMSISIATFIHPFEEVQVRSMREIGGIGTPPWPHDLEQKTMLLGAESLVGYAITRGSTVVVPNRTDATFFPVHWTEYEESVVVVPIFKGDNVAGGFLVASAIPNYFTSGQPVIAVVEAYAHLAQFVFAPEEYVTPGAIALGFLPEYALQAPYFRDFSKRVLQQLRLGLVRGRHVTLEQAQRQVWREIEEALLQVFLQTMKRE